MPFESQVPALRSPRRALAELRQAVIPPDTPPDAVAELVIKIDQDDINMREFAAYLNFIDRTYGRLTPEGLFSYAQRRAAQVRISSIRSGSIDVVISELISQSEHVTRLVVLYLLLKHLPSGLNTLATAYRDYEEGRLTRARRKQLREQVQEDDEIEALDRERKNQLVRFLDDCYQQEQRQAPRVRRFTITYVQNVMLQIKQKDDDEE